MSTNALIAYQFPDEHVEDIYLHWDGYVEGAGHTLRDHYYEPETIEALLALGGLSSLDDTPAECNAYHRDRGEAYEPNRPRTSPTMADFFATAKDGGWDGYFVYLKRLGQPWQHTRNSNIHNFREIK